MMKIQSAIKKAQKTTGKIRLKRWLPRDNCLYVENAYIRQNQNESRTGTPHVFSIEELLTSEWEVGE